MTIPFSIALTGFAAIVSQIVFMRELLCVFYGNELSIAFMLAGWLSGGAFGSAVLGRLSDRIKPGLAVFAACQLALSALLPLNILLIRSIKPLIGVNPGEIIPFFPMVMSVFAVMVPACAAIGFLFSLGCRVYEQAEMKGAERIGRVYVLEAAGAIAGGLVASFVLVRLLGSVQIMALLGLLLAAAAALVLRRAPRSGMRNAFAAVALAVLLAEAVVASAGWRLFDRYSRSLQWQGYEVLGSRNSIYGNVTVARNGSQYSFFDNGLHLYTVPDRRSSEEAVHFAMLEHPDPKDVLLIGGGLGGLAGEILKHPVRRLDYVELDPLIFRMAKEHLPAAYYEALEDRRVRLHLADGRSFVKRAAGTYDVIIVSLGDPYTAQLNRFYTAEFFNEAKRALRSGGVLSFGLGSSESYMSKELREFLGSIRATLASAFADVKVLPGETAFFLASADKGLLTYDQGVLMKRASERRLDLKYVREYYLASRLSAQMVDYTERSLTAGGAAGLNRDFHPVSYYYDMIFWSARFKDSLFTRALKGATVSRVVGYYVSALLLIALFGLWGPAGGRSLRRASVLAVAANGFSQMAFQIVILLAFQIIYGYLFFKLGVIMTAFMAGLAIGGHCAVKALPRFHDERRPLVLAQAALCIYPVILLPVLRALSGAGSGLPAWIGSNIVFAALPLASGFIGGFLFPLANRIFLGPGREVGYSGGFNYGMDLLGACAGALAVGAFLVPVLGIPATCFTAAALNATALLITVLSPER